MKSILIVGSQENNLGFFECDFENCQQLDKWENAHADRVWDIESVNDETLITVSQDRSVKLWDVKEKICTATLEGHSDVVFECATHPSLDIFATCSKDFSVKLWNHKTQKEVSTLKHEDCVRSVIFLENTPNLLCSGSWDSCIRLWDVEKQIEVQTLKEHTGWIRSLTYDPYRQTLISGGEDKNLIVWDMRTSKSVNTITDLNADKIFSMTVFSNQQLLVCGSEEGSLIYYDLLQSQVRKEVEAHADVIWKVLKFSLPPVDLKEEEEKEEEKEGEVEEEGEEEKKVEEEVKGEENEEVSSEVFEDKKEFPSSDSSKYEGIITCSYDETVKLWDLEGNCKGTLSVGEKALSMYVCNTSKFNEKTQSELRKQEIEHEKDVEALEGLKKSAINSSENELDGLKKIVDNQSKQILEISDERHGLQKMISEMKRRINEMGKKNQDLERANLVLKETEIKTFQELKALRNENSKFRAQKKKNISSMITVREITGLHKQIDRHNLREKNLHEVVERLKLKIQILERRNIAVAQRTSTFLERSFQNMNHLNSQCVSSIRREGKVRWSSEKNSRKLSIEKTRNKLLGNRMIVAVKRFKEVISELEIENKRLQRNLVKEKELGFSLQKKLLEGNQNMYNIRMTYEKEIEKLEKRKNIEMKIILSCITEKQKKIIADGLQIEFQRLLDRGNKISTRPNTASPGLSRNRRRRRKIKEPSLFEEEGEQIEEKISPPIVDIRVGESVDDVNEGVEQIKEEQEQEVVEEDGEVEKKKEEEEEIPEEIKEKIVEKEKEKEEVVVVAKKKKKRRVTKKKKIKKNNRKRSRKRKVSSTPKKKKKNSEISPSVFRRRKRKKIGERPAKIDSKDPVFFIPKNRVEGRVHVQKEHQDHRTKNLRFLELKRREILMIKKSMVKKEKEKRKKKRNRSFDLDKFFQRTTWKNREVQFPEIHGRPDNNQFSYDNNERGNVNNVLEEREKEVEEVVEKEKLEEDEGEESDKESTCLSDPDDRMDDLILEDGDEDMFENDQ